MKEKIQSMLSKYLGEWYIPEIKIIDIVEIIIIAYLVYQLIVWIKNTKAWMLLKGIIVLGSFIFVASPARISNPNTSIPLGDIS